MLKTIDIWCPHCERDVEATTEEALVRYTEADTEEVILCPLCDEIIMSIGEFSEPDPDAQHDDRC